MKAAAIYFVIAAAAATLFGLDPAIDIVVSRQFYLPGHGFAFAAWLPAVLLHRAIPWLTGGIFVLLALAAAWLALIGRPLWRLDRKAIVFVFLAVAIGPGLLANTALKDHWGRARPAQTEAFGGARHFTPALQPATQCTRNCSFVSGDAALGFSLVAFAFLLPSGRPRRRGEAAALGFGALVGLVRIAQGGHFLSDVVFAGLLVYGTTALLHWWVVVADGLALPGVPGIARRIRSSRASRFGLPLLVAALFVPVSMAAIDRPLAFYLHARGPDLHALFMLIGELGLGWGWLTGFALAFVMLHWGCRFPRLRRFASPMRALSALPAFLFAAVAASGLVVDLLKLLFGRTRPKLLFASGQYDFTWLALRSDHWSFPSGHAATIVALMTALWLIWPRHLLFYILAGAIIVAARVVVDAHYLSDVVAGGLVAIVVTRAVAAGFARSGIDLETARRGLAPRLPPWPCRGFAGQRSQSAAATERCNIAPTLSSAPHAPEHRDLRQR
jgi:lipid A 4'-phosphatase